MKAWPRLHAATRVVAAIMLLEVAAAAVAAGLELPPETQLQWEVLGRLPDHDVAVTPAVKPYALRADLSNVEKADALDYLTAGQKTLLAANGFLVLPSASKEFYEIYYNPAPLVTADCLLHAYHVLLAETLTEAETHYLAKRQAELALAGYRRMKTIQANMPRDLKDPANKAMTYWAVAARLVDPKIPVSEDVASRVEAEVRRIQEATYIGLVADKLPNRDYTVFKPIAGYARSEDLRDYFVLNRYFTLWTLEFKSDAGAQACMLAALAVGTDEKARQAYIDIARCRQFLGGMGEDPTPLTVLTAARRIFGATVTDKFPAGAENLAKLRKVMAVQPEPRIADQPQLYPGADPMAGYGMRMFAPGVSVRAIAYQHVAQARALTPRGEHIAAVLGTELPTVTHDLPLLQAAQAELDARGKQADRQDLHTLMMLSLRRLPAERGKGYPSFMNTDAWSVKTANTQMGSWSEVEHDLCLYVKDNTLYMCETMLPEGFHGYVEPTPRFYAALAAVAGRTREAFKQMGVFQAVQEAMPPRPEDAPHGWRPEKVAVTEGHFSAFESLLQQVRDMAVAELENRTFTEEQVALLKRLGMELKHLAFNDSTSPQAREPMSVVVRIAREYLEENGRYVGVGRPLKIIAVVPYAGKLYWCTGGVYSYYEFDRPLRQQLDDREWKAMTAGPTAVQPYKPWLMDKNLGIDAGEVSAGRIRAWLPNKRISLGNVHGHGCCESLLHDDYTMQALNQLGSARLTDQAVDLAAKAFIEGRYDEHITATLYVLLRSAPGERRAATAAASMKEFEKAVGADDSKFTGCNARAWLYFALRLHEGVAPDTDTTARIARFSAMASALIGADRYTRPMAEMVEAIERVLRTRESAQQQLQRGEPAVRP